MAQVVVAYEPVMGYRDGEGGDAGDSTRHHGRGARRTAPHGPGPDAAEVMPLLYGGSVTAENITGFAEQHDIDGALVGGASLQAVPIHGYRKGRCACQTRSLGATPPCEHDLRSPRTRSLPRLPVVFIVGATASGKTTAAIALAAQTAHRGHQRRQPAGLSRHVHRHGEADAEAARRLRPPPDRRRRPPTSRSTSRDSWN